MELSKQQLSLFRSIIKDILESDKQIKVEAEKVKAEKKLQKEEDEYNKSKHHYKPVLKDVVEAVKDILFYDTEYEQSKIYDTDDYIHENSDINLLKQQVDMLINDFCKELINK